jgi:hypothetical protein
MLGWITEKTGGLFRDGVEMLEDVGEEIVSMPDRFSKGYGKGCMTTPKKKKKKKFKKKDKKDDSKTSKELPVPTTDRQT